MSDTPPPWQQGEPQPPFGPPPGSDPYGGAYQQQPYGAGGYGQPVPRPNNVAIAALIVGILAVLGTITIIGGVVLGLVAVVLGVVGLSKSRELQRGRGQAIAGIVLGGIALLLSAALVALGLIAYTELSGNGSVTEDLEYPVEYDGIVGG